MFSIGVHVDQLGLVKASEVAYFIYRMGAIETTNGLCGGCFQFRVSSEKLPSRKKYKQFFLV